MENTKLAIVIATYKRADGKTPGYLYKALECVTKQTYKNYKVFLIGDDYDDYCEITDILKSLNNPQIEFENLLAKSEREQYSGMDLWVCGGLNAINYAIEKALSEGYEYICHLDHDDWWYENHLEVVNQCILDTNSDFICTVSTYRKPTSRLPYTNNVEKYINFYPKYAGLIHSSVCMNFKKIPLFYRNVYEETGIKGMPADGDLWNRVKNYIITNNLKSTLINQLTCRHDEEGYEINKLNTKIND